MTMSEDPKKAAEEIKVTDRRSFTTAGDRRTPDQPKGEPPRKRPAPAPGSGGEGAEAHGVSFDEFARYLAQVALHQMGSGSEREGGESSQGLEEARQTIQILTMLKEKTRGNLAPQESQTLDDLLYHLKIEFTRRAAAPRR